MRVSLFQAVSLLARSLPVAIPTETVWGLAARAEDKEGISQIFALKNRPPSNPLIVHINSRKSLESYVQYLPDEAIPLIETFWPGGLTLVLPVKEGCLPDIARAGLPTAAFRMPDHETALELIEKSGPLVAPSANKSGRPSATLPEHVEEDFGVSLPILDTAIPCRHGIESTILIWKKPVWHIGRFGAISPCAIEKVIGYSPLHHSEDRPMCPGQMFRHYAPNALLTLNAVWNQTEASLFDAVLGFSDRSYSNAQMVLNMGASTNPEACMFNLYGLLRELDRRSLHSVFVDTDVPSSPQWFAFLDRLKRAAGG
jgi:L-threonylcarbamoyladenylate synthase